MDSFMTTTTTTNPTTFSTKAVDPWNAKNKLLTVDDVYRIYERAGFQNARTCITINDLRVYQTAFVHSSYIKKNSTESSLRSVSLSEKPSNVLDLFDEADYTDYENQEFLGDRALDFAVAFYIYRKYPQTDQGFKTVLKTKLVKKNTLARFAMFLEFPPHLILSRQVEQNTQLGRQNNRILEDVMEAFICAIFLDQNQTPYHSQTLEMLGHHRLIGPGWPIVCAFVENLLEKVIDFEELLAKEENYKEQLLQYYQREFFITPEYLSISIEGPPHRRIFTQGVLDKDGNIISRGVGKNKSEAEQMASMCALQYYGVIGPKI